MARIKVPDRQHSVTRVVEYHLGNGRTVKLHVTVSFSDETMTVPVAIFCADFKAGSDFHALVMDTCILISRLLQHEDDPKSIRRSLAHPLVLTLIRTIEEIHQ